MKTYSAPSMISQGNVVESTRTSRPGTRDPKNVLIFQLEAFGSVGFQL
jgi:hypothetical protein